MKIQIVVIDLEISPRVKRAALWIGLPIAALVGASAVARAAVVPKAWTSGEALKAMDLNTNFASLDSRANALDARITALESLAPNAAHAATADTATTATSVATASVRFESSAWDGTKGCQSRAIAGRNVVICTCAPNEVAISGGAYAGAWTYDIDTSVSDGVTGSSAREWQLGCHDSGGNPQGCANPFAVCLRVQ
jgi:hypothetical protein